MKDLFPSSRGQAVADTIITFDEGIYVAFKQEYRIQSELNPTVEMQIGCAVRLLDAEPLGLRYANHHFPYTYLTLQRLWTQPLWSCRRFHHLPLAHPSPKAINMLYRSSLSSNLGFIYQKRGPCLE